MIHIWCEDSNESVTVKLWQFLCNTIGSKKFDFDILGTSSNHELVKLVRLIYDEKKFNSKDVYLIFIDNDYDSKEVERLVNDIDEITSKYQNVIRVGYICIEYTLLKFEYLSNWIRPTWSEKLADRFDYIKEIVDIFCYYVDRHIDWRESDKVVEYVFNSGILNKKNYEQLSQDDKLSMVSIENVSYLLLTDLINYRKRHFSVTKTSLGDCWTCNCCNISNEKMCNLLNTGLSSKEKAECVYYRSPLHKIIKRAGEKLE